MKGDVLDFDAKADSGLISGDDGKRYRFAGPEWKSVDTPRAGLKVDFEAQDGRALAVYMVPTTSVQSGDGGMPQNRLLKYRGFYRSSDEKTLGGVSGGLAHMWGTNRRVIQFLFLILSLFYGVGILLYVILWFGLEEVPTAGVDSSGRHKEQVRLNPAPDRPSRPKSRPNIVLTVLAAVFFFAFLRFILAQFQ